MILFCILLQSYEWLPRKRSNLERMLADQNQPLGILLQFVFHFLQRHPHGAGRSNTSCRQKDNITYQIGWFFVKFSKGGGCVCVSSSQVLSLHPAPIQSGWQIITHFLAEKTSKVMSVAVSTHRFCLNSDAKQCKNKASFSSNLWDQTRPEFAFPKTISFEFL